VTVGSMEEELYASLAEVVRKDYPGSIVTHFTAVVTVVDDEGTEMILTLDRPEQALWQSMGLLKFVEELRSALIKDRVTQDEDEDE
jgi:hypothetical protein